MRQTGIELAVLDMAGTTVQDEGQVPAAFAVALREHGVDVSDAHIRAVRGASKRAAICELLPDGPERETRADRVYASFRTHLAERFAGGVREVAGAAEAIRRLRAHGVRVALNTGFDRDTTGMLLAALGWREGLVDAVVCGDDVARGRPAPYLIFRCMEATGVASVHGVANVGDTALDLQAGHNAGVRYNVGVLTGAHGRERLEAEPHTHLLASVAELPALVAAV